MRSTNEDPADTAIRFYNARLTAPWHRDSVPAPKMTGNIRRNMTHPKIRLLLKFPPFLAALILVEACAETTPISPSTSGKPGDFKAEANFPKFTDIPIPPRPRWMWTSR